MEMLVAADDRTGAHETAAALADHGAGVVPVTAWPPGPANDGIAVIDIATRHLDPAKARERTAAIATSAGAACGRAAHKIDSTLRGNWPDELAEWARARPVLMVPALPALGRTCVDGVVLADGRPVHDGAAGTDARRPVTTSRPADLLVSASVTSVTHAPTAAALATWLARPAGVCVADAATTCDVIAVVRAWAPYGDVVLAGTSAVIGASASVLGTGAPGRRPPRVAGPVLVVCGSLHPAARAQIDHAEAAGVPVVCADRDDDPGAIVGQMEAAGVVVLATGVPGGPIEAAQATEVATRLRSTVDEVARRTSIGALVVIGGDTAAAVLGGSPSSVHGSVLPGTAWVTVPDRPCPVVTRAGGFGDARALVDLVRAVRGR